MSVALPVVAIVFGSVTPPQGDVIDLRVHLGCTNEVSSFDCLLQNFDKKYSPGGTYPIKVGDDGSISIGRGANCPLILTLRVEEILCESTPVENYIRIFRRRKPNSCLKRTANQHQLKTTLGSEDDAGESDCSGE